MKRISRGSSELSSSATVVESNDDLLIEILLRLPIVSLHVFKSVSKRWLTLITNPTFTLHRIQSHIIDSPSGIFLKRQGYFKYDFIPLDIRIPTNRSRSPPTFNLKFDSDEVKILQSCNGLLLCRTRIDAGKLYVYNPSLNLFKTIPQSHYRKYYHDIGDLRMAFDPTKSPHYKILYAETIGNGDHSIQTYSSKTCNWSVCGDKFSSNYFDGFHDGIYWNDAIHWLGDNDLHFKLDVEHLSLTRTDTPRALDEKMYCKQKLFESRGCLLLCKEHIHSDTHSRQLNIYEMSKGGSGWLVKYIVHLDDIIIKAKKPQRKPPGWFCSRVLCVMIGKKEEDSFLVMEIFGKIIQYKVVLKTISKIYKLKPINSPTSFEFIASFDDV